jgi:hypothetical protein
MSIPPPGPSRILALPRELRDIVYDYALTEDDGLLLVERSHPNASTRSFKGCSHNSRNWDANRLQHVCRLLYAETKGLGLGLNELTFDSLQPSADFGAFFARCLTYQQQRIRKVTVDGRRYSCHGPYRLV